jgi:hypothetical protein
MAADLMEGHSTDRESVVPTRVEYNRADSIPRRVLLVALAILLLVGGVVYVAVRSIHTLGNSSDTLVQVGLPLQKQLLKIKSTQRQAEFFRQLAQVLPQAGYEKTFIQLVTSEEHDLQTLQRATRNHPVLMRAMQQLQGSLVTYAQTVGDSAAAKASKAAVEKNFRPYIWR